MNVSDNYSTSKLLTAAVVGTLSIASIADAATVSYTGLYPGPTVGTKTATDWNGGVQNLQLQKFDTSLGTLVSASLTLFGEITTSGKVTNPSSTSTVEVNQYDSSLRMIIGKPSSPGPYVNLAAATAAKLTEVLPVIVSLAPTTIAPLGSVSFGPTTSNATKVQAIAVGDLGSWQTVGLGFATLSLFTQTKTVSDLTGGNLTLVQTTAAEAFATVTYDYTPAPPSNAPEPATLAILGLGLAGLAATQRRRQG
jgi:hypothetical protein